ncbi:cytochrome C [Alsobacter soli]|uniref:Cytochrome C n=1 Tax=Alsobacter soli TaxID=2109933 RepID=A0A2T1HY44_9HYPH|nr:cytochrome c [Alsobacter soli]PSC06534.1 cytochrome C [Alsobacter soli]
MIVQKRYDTDEPSSLWRDGASSRTAPEGAVPVDAAAQDAARQPPPVTPALLARGRERYEIACAPCHGLSGYGDGVIVSRGFPAPLSYHEPRLRSADASHFIDVIEHGYGVMYPYAARVAPKDRWAIVAYIRALQLSQAARVADAPQLRERLP